MFIGHFAVALAAKKVVPKTSLATLIFSAQFLDLLWPIFLLTGVEHVRIDPGNTPVTPLDFYDYPLSHSLLTAVAWSVVVGGLYFLIKRDAKTATILYLVVLSHWVLDFITHRPDLPLIPWSDVNVGLGLWNSMGLTMLVELGLFLAGVAMYVRTTAATTTGGKVGFWLLLAFLLFVWLASLFGPPPPSVDAIGVAGLSMWLIVLYAWWVDRARQLRL
jgi:hypothetical protein